jgi:hypothetical protein
MAGIMPSQEDQVANNKDSRSLMHPDRFPLLTSLVAALFRLHHRTCQFTILGGEHEGFAHHCDGPALTTTWHFAFPANEGQGTIFYPLIQTLQTLPSFVMCSIDWMPEMVLTTSDSPFVWR